MKKFLLSLLLTIVLAPTVKAQDYIFDNPDNNSYWGVRLGFDIMSLQSPSDIYGNRGGIELGVIYNKPLWKNLFVEPGISLFYNSANINGLPDYVGVYIAEGTINNWGFRIPVNFGYHFDVTDAIQIVPFTGPQFDINFSNGTSYNFDAVLSGALAPKLHYNAIDMGWNFGVGVKVSRYYVGISGTVGISRYITQNKTDYTLSSPGGPILYPFHARRNLFQIILGYNF